MARGPEPGPVHECPAHHRTPAVEALPVVRELPHRQGQRRGRQELRAHPGEHGVARVHHHQVAVAVPARKRPPHRLEEQAPQPAAVPVGEEVADVRPEGAPVTQMVVAVDGRVPEPPALRVRHGLQAQRPEIAEPRRDLRLRVGGGGPGRPAGGPHVADAPLPPRRQPGDAVALQGPGMPRQAPTLQAPFAVVQPRCPRMVLPSPLRLSLGSSATVSWMSAVRRRVRRRPEKVVDLRSVIRRSMAGSRICPTPAYEPASACQWVWRKKSGTPKTTPCQRLATGRENRSGT